MTYGYINTEQVRELASQGLNANKIGAILGHSRTGIYLHCLKNGIELVNGSIRFVNVDGVKMPIGEACALKGFTRESMYQYRINRGLNLQDGFDTYVLYLYMQTKQATDTVRSKNIMLMFRQKLQTLTVIKSILGLGECFLMFMRNNDYKQQALDRYLYMKGLK